MAPCMSVCDDTLHMTFPEKWYIVSVCNQLKPNFNLHAALKNRNIFVCLSSITAINQLSNDSLLTASDH